MATIAVIDDLYDNAELLKIMLQSACHTDEDIKYFSSGRDFLAAVGSQSFHLVLLDLSMPEMDGFEVLKRLREIDSAVPVIAVTAHAYTWDRKRAMQHGFSDYVTKPIMDVKGFCSLVDHYLKT